MPKFHAKPFRFRENRQLCNPNIQNILVNVTKQDNKYLFQHRYQLKIGAIHRVFRGHE